VAGEDEGEIDEVAAEWVRTALKDFDALGDFEPVAGEAAERLLHAGEESDGRGAGAGSGLNHEGGQIAGCFERGEEGAGADLDVEHKGVKRLGELLAHDAGGDEKGRLDGAGVVAHGVEEAVGGDEGGSLADERGTCFTQDSGEAREGELGVEAGDGFELV